MEENLKFPFKAKAKLKNREGSIKLTEVIVTGLSADEEGFMGNDFSLEVIAGAYVIPVACSQLSHIKADDETLEALAIWNYWNLRK